MKPRTKWNLVKNALAKDLYERIKSDDGMVPSSIGRRKNIPACDIAKEKNFQRTLELMKYVDPFFEFNSTDARSLNMAVRRFETIGTGGKKGTQPCLSDSILYELGGRDVQQ